MKKIFLLVVLVALMPPGGLGRLFAGERPRVIVTTDGEADDKASMVRFLLTCNEFDVEAIVNSSSEFHWLGGRGRNALRPVDWGRDYIRLYARVYGNLKAHSLITTIPTACSPGGAWATSAAWARTACAPKGPSL